MGTIDLAVLDDSQFVRTYSGSIHPVAATFHRFVEAVARTGHFGRVRYLVPVRSLRIWEDDPQLPAVDQDVLEVIPTAPFGGIADYLVRSPYLTLRNWRPINRAVSESDLVWLRLPASNAPIALLAARRQGVPHFGGVAESVGHVAHSRARPPRLDVAARAVDAVFDEIARSAARSGPVATLGGEPLNSVIGAGVVEASRAQGPPPNGPPWRIAWAGGMPREKSTPAMFEAFHLLLKDGLDAQLVVVGDGPERAQVEGFAARMPAGRVRMAGHVGDFGEYLGLLRSTHVLAHPSMAEVFPNVIGEAMAAGVPVVANQVGGVAEVLGGGECVLLLPEAHGSALARAISGLIASADQRVMLRERGLDWAEDQTAERHAERMVGWLRPRFPHLPW